MRPTSSTTHRGARRRRRTTTVTASVVAAAALLAAGCSSGDDGASSETAASSSSAPGSALNAIDEAELQAMVDTSARDLGVPGALVFLRTPQGEFTAAYGTTEIGTETSPTVDTHVRIASISKSMTAATILLLAQEGKLALDDPISKYVDGVPNGDEITIANLLEMRSGLYNYTNDPRLAETIDADQGHAWDPQELLDMAFEHGTNAPPDTEYEYNNTNYGLLGRVVEEVDGKPLAEAVQDHVFGPLGMQESHIPPPETTTLPEPFSHGYLYGSSAHALGADSEYTKEQRAAVRAGTLQPTDYTGVNHTFAFGTGGVISTAADLATFFEAYVGGGLLDATYQDLLLNSLQEQVPGESLQLYGYGLSGVRWASNGIDFHGGETAGFNLFAGYDAANEVTLVVWTNLTVAVEDGAVTANALMLDVLDLIYTDSPLDVQPSDSQS